MTTDRKDIVLDYLDGIHAKWLLTPLNQLEMNCFLTAWPEISARLKFAEDVIRQANKRIDPGSTDTGDMIAARIRATEENDWECG